MRGLITSALVGLMLTACSAGAPEADTADADTLTRRQRDSIIGASSLPGAGVVKKALDASDAAAARGAKLDSVLNR